jgi:hypothetical protein
MLMKLGAWPALSSNSWAVKLLAPTPVSAREANWL